MASYPVPPPTYSHGPQGSKPSAGEYGALSQNAEDPVAYASGSTAPRNDWDAEGGDSDDIEDFKIGVTVSQSSQDVRHAFVAKVYGVLFCQILGTAIVGWLLSMDPAKSWVQSHPGWMMIPTFGAIFVMLGVYIKRHSHPLNIILLGVFTLFEALTVGSIVSYYDQLVVLQALIITVFVFLGLTLFTFQSKYDFSKMGSYLFAGLLVLLMTSVVGIFIPYSSTMDMIIAGGGTLLFSAYIVYDTHILLRKLHIDDWVMACVSLYLDILNLFLMILRLLSSDNDR